MLELLDLVKLPRAFAPRMPRQLSGGQKQRIGVARAFAGNAKVVVADEPVSALDVSVQAAVTELLMDIQRKNKTTMLFISHDLSVVRYIADRVVVMYLGHVVEQGTTDQIFAPPYHPYTEALLSAIPIADTSVVKKHIVLEGDIPSAMNPPTGCPFQTRCRYKQLVPDDNCETQVPPPRPGQRPSSAVLAVGRRARQDGAGHHDRIASGSSPSGCRSSAWWRIGEYVHGFGQQARPSSGHSGFLVEALRQRRLDRREFLRTATLLGMSATLAWGVAGGDATAQTPEAPGKAVSCASACPSRRSPTRTPFPGCSTSTSCASATNISRARGPTA